MKFRATCGSYPGRSTARTRSHPLDCTDDDRPRIPSGAKQRVRRTSTEHSSGNSRSLGSKYPLDAMSSYLNSFLSS